MIEQGYDFYLADTDAGKSIHFGLRYQVYCLRERYEDPTRHPNFLEQDEYDAMAVHFLARCRRTGVWVGAMRVIVGPVQNLPVSKFLSIDVSNSSKPDWRTVAEASRLCTLLPTNISSKFAPNESKPISKYGLSHGSGKNLQTSWVVMGLIRAGRQYCLLHGVKYGIFLISDPLARILRRMGMDIEPIGSPCQHRGWRSPYIHNVKTGYESMAQRSPELYKSFCQQQAYTLYSRMADDGGDIRIAATA